MSSQKKIQTSCFNMNIEKIGIIETDFDTKFGIPRQSGLVSSLKGRIIFDKDYRDRNYIRGLEGYSHIWVIWGFSENEGKAHSPTVRPPKLGGNERMGVFATRSPFRPNNLGLSCLKLDGIEYTEQGAILNVLGADMVNGTPIYDIKPYLSFTDSVPEAVCGFADTVCAEPLKVVWKKEAKEAFPSEKSDTLTAILAEDPRPSYIEDGDRIYGFIYAGYEIKFSVREGVLTVLSAEKRTE